MLNSNIIITISQTIGLPVKQLCITLLNVIFPGSVLKHRQHITKYYPLIEAYVPSFIKSSRLGCYIILSLVLANRR